MLQWKCVVFFCLIFCNIFKQRKSLGLGFFLASPVVLELPFSSVFMLFRRGGDDTQATGTTLDPDSMDVDTTVGASLGEPSAKKPREEDISIGVDR